jgi:hypothetical protein
MPSTTHDTAVVFDIDDDWMGRYEDLRHGALSAQCSLGGHGLALLLRRGLVAWMRAWPRSGPRLPKSGVDLELKPGPCSGLVPQMATIVANMLLGKPREVRV